jgi:pimeloyl-[acyl-carrier protein] synthase
MDFIWDFAVPLPILVISELVGVPEDDREQVKRWCDDFSIVALNFYANISSDQLTRGLQSVKEFRTYLEGQIEKLNREPRQDLLSSLVLAEHEGHRLTLDELLANAILLLNAGNETTSNLLGNGLLALLQHAEQLARLRAEPTLIPDAVEECLRFDSPVQFQGRVALADTECAGVSIRRRQLVLPVLGAANRDPAHFPEPDRFDVLTGRSAADGMRALGAELCRRGNLATALSARATERSGAFFAELRPGWVLLLATGTRHAGPPSAHAGNGRN